MQSTRLKLFHKSFKSFFNENSEARNEISSNFPQDAGNLEALQC